VNDIFRWVRNFEVGMRGIYISGKSPKHYEIKDVGFEAYDDVDDLNR
jgi:hypothetical protein